MLIQAFLYCVATCTADPKSCEEKTALQQYLLPCCRDFVLGPSILCRFKFWVKNCLALGAGKGVMMGFLIGVMSLSPMLIHLAFF